MTQETTTTMQRIVWRNVSAERAQEAIDFLAKEGYPGLKYIGTITTLPGHGGPGGRPDSVFDLPVEHVGRIAVWRFGLENPFSWWEDYVANDGDICPSADKKKYTPEGFVESLHPGGDPDSIDMADETRSEDAAFVEDDCKYPHIHVKLVGESSNAFFILGRVKAALKKGGVSAEEIEKFVKEASSGDYDHLLQTCMKWVAVS